MIFKKFGIRTQKASYRRWRIRDKKGAYKNLLRKRDQIANRLGNDTAIPEMRNGRTREKKPNLGALLFSTSRSLETRTNLSKNNPLVKRKFYQRFPGLLP